MTGTGDVSKRALRAALLKARTALTEDEREARAKVLLTTALGLPELATARRVAAYLSIGPEPDTRELVETLWRRGVEVLLPVLLQDNDLDWVRYQGPSALVEARWGLLEPTGLRLGREAVTGVDVMFLPGLAVDGEGLRLGRGGGSYDRVLGRMDSAGNTATLIVLLYEHEILPHVPGEPHDRPVTAVVTPEGVTRFGGPW